jgi:hypothetical protein
MQNAVNPTNLGIEDKGPSCSDLRQNLRFNALYRLPGIKSTSFASKFVNGWWLGGIVSAQGGYAFTPLLNSNRSLDGRLSSAADRVSLVTTATAGTGAGAGKNFVPYDPNTVITGDPNQWFNPYMFDLGPVGVHGNIARGILRGPGLFNTDISVNKDTSLLWLGEKGSLQFRAELFNVFNRANFGTPNGTAFSGSTNDAPGPTEAALSTAGQITTTATNSRQIQLALKVVF